MKYEIIKKESGDKVELTAILKFENPFELKVFRNSQEFKWLEDISYQAHIKEDDTMIIFEIKSEVKEEEVKRIINEIKEHLESDKAKEQINFLILEDTIHKLTERVDKLEESLKNLYHLLKMKKIIPKDIV